MPDRICPNCWRLIDHFCGFCGLVIPKLPDNMVPIPAGSFTMGTTDEQRSVLAMLFGKDVQQLQLEHEMPQEIILPRACYINRYPVTVSQFAQFVATLSPSQLQGLGIDKLKPPTTDEMDLPATGMTWAAAVRYAHWCGKRLPTEAEWEAAAGWDPRAGVKRIFPWGNEVDPDSPKCNLEGNVQTVLTYDIDDARSPLGCCDIVGNVSEWCADPFSPKYHFSPYEKLDINPLQPVSDKPRTIRGGSCQAGIEQCRVAWRDWSEPWSHSPLIGFRCVMDVRGTKTA